MIEDNNKITNLKAKNHQLVKKAHSAPKAAQEKIVINVPH